jgi:hypothetical protein
MVYKTRLGPIKPWFRPQTALVVTRPVLAGAAAITIDTLQDGRVCVREAGVA